MTNQQFTELMKTLDDLSVLVLALLLVSIAGVMLFAFFIVDLFRS